MSMTDETPPIRPQTETNILLGRLMEKVDAFKEEQGLSRTEVVALRGEVSTLITRVAILEAKQAPKTPWYSIIGGITSGVVGLSAVIALVAVFAQLGALK